MSSALLGVVTFGEIAASLMRQYRRRPRCVPKKGLMKIEHHEVDDRFLAKDYLEGFRLKLE